MSGPANNTPTPAAAVGAAAAAPTYIYAPAAPHGPYLTEGLVLRPDVRVIGRSTLDAVAVRHLLDAHGTAWQGVTDGVTSARAQVFYGNRLVEFAGRVCYWSFGARQSQRTNQQYIENLLQQGHGSVLEHATWTLYIEGVSRTLTHELVRHRTGVAISQLSQRFLDDPDLLRLVVPPLALADPAGPAGLLTNWGLYLAQTRSDYRTALEQAQATVAGDPRRASGSKHAAKKMAAEAARAVLPGCTETRLVWTINARTARDFLVKRGGEGVDAEMRRFAVELASVLYNDRPEFFPDLTFHTLGDGTRGVLLTLGRA